MTHHKELLMFSEELEPILVSNGDSSNLDPVKQVQAKLLMMQFDLLNSFATLTENKDTLIARAIICRSLIDYRANSNYIGSDAVKASKYLRHTEAIGQMLDNNLAKIKNENTTMKEVYRWTMSSARDRVAKMGYEIPLLYDSLSDFVHGNHVLDFFNNQQMLIALERAISESYLILLKGAVVDAGCYFSDEVIERKLGDAILNLTDEVSMSV